MNYFIKFIIGGVLLLLFSLWLEQAHTEQLPKEYAMKTETGEIVLTQEPCEFTKMGLEGYPYAAYATEKGHANHEGCWTTDIVDRFKAIKIYFPEIDATGVYNPNLFHPRLEPNV
jgi:hypothetical protein